MNPGRITASKIIKKGLSAGIFCMLLVIGLAEAAAFQDPAAHRQSPAAVIFDTDMGPDYDDVGAIALLHALADNGECKILATIASNQYPRVAAVLSAMNTYFNRSIIPIGVVRGNAVNIGCRQKWDSLVATKYPHVINTNDQAEDALALYRKVLASQPDGSVTIITVGFLTNMANLLLSVPDEYSPLDGEALIRKKVKLLVSMAGRFGEGAGSFKEFNVMKDAAASKIAFDGWPVPILFSGFEIGSTIFTGLPLVNDNSIKDYPVKDVFALSIPMDPNDRNGRMSWDETAVLVGVRGYEKYFDAVPGKVIGHPDGSTGWDASGHRDRYLVLKMPIPEIEKLIDDLMLAPARR